MIKSSLFAVMLTALASVGCADVRCDMGDAPDVVRRSEIAAQFTTLDLSIIDEPSCGGSESEPLVCTGYDLAYLAGQGFTVTEVPFRYGDASATVMYVDQDGRYWIKSR